MNQSTALNAGGNKRWMLFRGGFENYGDHFHNSLNKNPF